MVSTIYYVTQEKELLPAKEDFIENLIAPDEEQLCDFFENEVPFFVERFNAFDRDIFIPYDGDKFFQIDLCKDYTDENLIIEPEAVNTIYDMVDIAIKQGVTKWYLMPVVGYYC